MRPIHRSTLRSVLSLLLTVQFLLQPLSVLSPTPVFAAPLAEETRLSVLNDDTPTSSTESEESSANNLELPTPPPPPIWPEMDGLTLPQYTPSFDQPKEPETLRFPAPQPQPEQPQSAPVVAGEQLSLGLTPGQVTVTLPPNGGRAEIGQLPLALESAADSLDQSLQVCVDVLETGVAAQLSPVNVAFQLALANTTRAGDAQPLAHAAQPLKLSLDYGRLALPYGGSHLLRASKLASRSFNAADAVADASKLLNAADTAKFINRADNAGDAARAVKPDFYVRPNGEIIPATGYRYSKGEQFVTAVENGVLPSKKEGTYFSFDRYESSARAKDRLQLPYVPDYGVSFDTLPFIEDIHVPRGRWGQADYLEPITNSFPEWGAGGGTQAITYSPVPVSRDRLWRLR